MLLLDMHVQIDANFQLEKLIIIIRNSKMISISMIYIYISIMNIKMFVLEIN